jgi:copper chaperone CopZ
MKQTYTVQGMTCEGCVASVTEKLKKVPGVVKVQVDLKKEEAQIEMEGRIPLTTLAQALPEKYKMSKKEDTASFLNTEEVKETSKLEQLKPLFLIFIFLFSAAFLMNYKSWDMSSAMLDFMGLFYIVFSFFKLLDLKGFPDSFRMYDLLLRCCRCMPGFTPS